MIAIGSDHGGYKLKEEIKRYLEEKDIEYIDCGTFNEESVDYPDIAKAVAFFGSKDSDYLTGNILNVNGGFVI